MSHEVETMAWANEVPWHRLGREIGKDATPDQILRVADLDWNVSMKPVQWKMLMVFINNLINIFL